MRSLRLTALLLTVCLVALPAGLLNKPAEVRAWSNGVSGPNGYGTHDWILNKAIKTLKKRNNRADWVKLHAALWATDDPDTQNGIEYASSPWWHVYDIYGARYGNALGRNCSPKATGRGICSGVRASGTLRSASMKVGCIPFLQQLVPTEQRQLGENLANNSTCCFVPDVLVAPAERLKDDPSRSQW